jgi:hypothetical protein
MLKQNTNQFDASKITKYFRGQTKPETLEGQFKDPYFLPSENSLLAKKENGDFIGDDQKVSGVGAEDIAWANAHEIFGEAFDLFEDKIECCDIKQGSLGNCYFLCSLAALCEFPELIYQIFRTKERSLNGYYEICLFIEGEWQVVIVDDYFPVGKTNKKSFRFAKPNGNELWAVLLEKAWAKVNGGYRNTISGKENEALNCLTGFPSERYTVKDWSLDHVWSTVKKSDSRNNVMCCTTITDNNLKDRTGLVSLHAYTLIGCAEVTNKEGQQEKLVKIRNPWGHTEWKLKWSDNSDAWTDDIKKSVDFSDDNGGNDGVFWMNLKDFHDHYGYIAICSISANSNVKNFSFPVNMEDYAPRVYNINLREDTDLGISVIDRTFRFSRELMEDTSRHTLTYIMLVKYAATSIEFIDADFSFNTSVDLIKDLKAGQYALWVWNDCKNSYNKWEGDGFKNIHINISSNDKFYAKLQAEDTNFDFLKRIIYNALAAKEDIKTKDVYTKIENQFRSSGIGYRIVANNSKSTQSEWTNNPTIEGMNMIAPYENDKKFVMTVAPGDFDMYLGARISLYGKYWFNVSSNYKSAHTEFKQENIVNNNDDYYQIFCDCSISGVEINSDFYDYCSTKLTNDQPSFHQVDLVQIKLDEIISKYPKEWELLESVPEHGDTEGCTWEVSENNNTIYVGQLRNSRRHGKGVITFKEGKTGYFGQWTDGTKCGTGTQFDANYFVMYKGDYKNNQYHGNGNYFYNNGDKVEVIYVNGIREGLGTYYWDGGATWTGNFSNNKFHGEGDYTSGTSKWKINYNMGKSI